MSTVFASACCFEPLKMVNQHVEGARWGCWVCTKCGQKSGEFIFMAEGALDIGLVTDEGVEA